MKEFDKQNMSNEEIYFWVCQLARQLDSAVILINPKKGCTIDYVNYNFLRMTDYSEKDMIGATLSLLHGPQTDMRNEQAMNECIVNGLTFKTSSFHYRKDGSVFWNEMNLLPIRDQQGALQYCLLVMKDVTDTMNVETLIELERDIYFSLENDDTFEHVMRNVCNTVETTFGKKCHCSIVLVDENARMINVYGEMRDDLKQLDEEVLLMGISADNKERIQNPFIIKELRHSDYREGYEQLIDKYHLVSLWSQPILNTEGRIIGLFTMYFEQQAIPKTIDFKFLNRIAPIVTLAVKYFDQKNAIHRLAYEDIATGLKNFERFKITLQKLIKEGCAGHLYIAEPGEYQHIIDLYGRRGGDVILRQLATRIESVSTFADSVIARYTNSSIIIATRYSLQQMAIPQTEIDQILSEPYQIDGNEVYLTLKIGTSPFRSDMSFSEAIRQADTALSSALKLTGTVIKKFERRLLDSVQQEMNVLGHFSKGLKNNEFFPMLQPKVNLQTGKIDSFEALARWISPELGFVSPALFIPVAENTGNIAKLDREILQKILQWHRSRMDAGLALYQVSINISPSHFYSTAFVESSVALIKRHGVDPQFIKFEITESVELDNILRAKKIIDALQAYGIATAIDDFGVGYSSLSYLQELPFKEIKIDKSFVDNVSDKRMNAVIKTIIQLSHNLNMKSVAEGIETEQQHEELKKLGCEIGQGYFYYKPLPIEQINELLDRLHG